MAVGKRVIRRDIKEEWLPLTEPNVFATSAVYDILFSLSEAENIGQKCFYFIGNYFL